MSKLSFYVSKPLIKNSKKSPSPISSASMGFLVSTGKKGLSVKPRINIRLK